MRTHTRPSIFGRLRGLMLALVLLLAPLSLTVTPVQASATTISVTNLNDSGLGSLRQAIANAAAGDTVSFNLSSCPCTITLTSGELVINKNLIIAGPGAKVLTVSGNHASRVFQIPSGTFDVTISNLTVANGVVGNAGGAIRVQSNGTFNLINAAVINSRSTGTLTGQAGGGLEFRSVPDGGNLSIVGSTFSGNSAQEGGAIHLQSGDVHIRNTTIVGNTANGAVGGGISNWLSNLTIANSTITGNSSTGTSSFGTGGGVVNLNTTNTTVLNSIIAGNSGVNPDVGDTPAHTGRFISLGNNLIGNNQGAQADFPEGIPNANGDLVGTSAAPVNPMLASLADNGGPTPTLALLANSPATNAGNPATPGSGSPACELTDQRGYARPDRCDIGAFELNGILADSTPPAASPTQSPAANSNGWNNRDVTVTWNWSDSGTGIDSENCTTSSTSSGEGTLTLRATCKDKVGNAGSAEYTVNVDKTVPTISAAATTQPNSNGWYNTNVTIRFTCADNLSGVANCPADQVVSSEGSAVSSTAQTVTDKAGNQSAASNVVTVQIDKTAPIVTVTGVSNGATYPLGSVPAAACSTTDALSGVASVATLGVTGGNADGTGSLTATCSGAADKAGNNGSASASYTVAYLWSGFFQPVDNLPTVNSVKAGSAFPVKFSLGGNYGLNIFANGYPKVQTVACSSGAPADEVEQTVTAGSSSLSYDAATGQYTYTWKTDRAWAGSCRQLVMRLIDGTEHMANFKFK